MNLSPTHTHPAYPFINLFETLQVIISCVWVIHKGSNVNWKKIHSIMLSVTCHGFRNFPPLLHIPSYPLMNFWNPTIDYFLSLSHLLKIECKLEKHWLNNFICHLSFLKNYLLLIHIPSYLFVNFWNPTSYYFLS